MQFGRWFGPPSKKPELMRGYRSPQERAKDLKETRPASAPGSFRAPENGRFRCAICDRVLTPDMDWSHIIDQNKVLPFFWVFCSVKHLEQFQYKVMSNFAALDAWTLKKALERAYHSVFFNQWMAGFKNRLRGGGDGV